MVVGSDVCVDVCQEIWVGIEDKFTRAGRFALILLSVLLIFFKVIRLSAHFFRLIACLRLDHLLPFTFAYLLCVQLRLTLLVDRTLVKVVRNTWTSLVLHDLLIGNLLLAIVLHLLEEIGVFVEGLIVLAHLVMLEIDWLLVVVRARVQDLGTIVGWGGDTLGGKI
jgi:hypothetical protein